ncbi:unnamed protein product [Brachionus calyciflorus]|uniref:Large ribosomal subunit protein uL22m n=1 Tax=Brachionus calyciflorus TaxID=104777 RepID=A0A813U9I5_9BILA|nr:unnamed protein product [Brachionus calyciflorus]
MLRNLSKSLCYIQQNLVNKLCVATTGAMHTSSIQFVNKKEQEGEEDEFDKQRLASAKIRNLERLGTIKSHYSWPQYNRIIYPPAQNGQPIRNPFVHHMRHFIKYPAKKMWYPAFLIRGMSIDEALKQLSFHRLKGADIIKEVLLEAQDLALKQHNFEFKSNMWISYSTAVDSFSVKGVRKHRAMRLGVVEYKYCTYYVRLEEGSPPAKYELQSETYDARAKEYLEKLRKRSIHLSI